MAYSVKIDNQEFKVDVDITDRGYACVVNGEELVIEVLEKGQQGELIFMLKNRPFIVSSNYDGGVIVVNGEDYVTEVVDEQVKKLLMAGPDALHKKELVITAPMPGLVVDVEVRDGTAVKEGQGLLIVEAMKMQNEIKSPRDGIVRQILVQRGQTVNSKDKLIIIE